METTLPRWSVRLNATRPPSAPGFSDLIPVVGHHFHLHVQAAEFLGPFNSKQRAATGRPYIAPDRETLRQVIRQGRVNDFTYQGFISSVIRFCEQTKGNRALPTPHPSVIHSIQLPAPAFQLTQVEGGDTMVEIAGVETPLVVKGLRQPDEVRFIIARPKLSQLGTASAKDWEVLFWRTNLGYIPDWTDSSLNPRYSGIY